MDYINSSRFSKFEAFVTTHKGKTFNAIISSPDYISFLESFPTVPYKIALISIELQNRADLLSFAAYGTPAYWWLIVLFNGIRDPFSELVVNKEIKIPQF